MQRAAFATLDWFIPNASTSERSEIGLARSFVVTHLFGPPLIQFIVLFTLMTDPRPNPACWAMVACVTAFWLLPFGLRLTRDLQLMALISVELLCVVSLIGSSFYGGVTSPFLPWLLVSLMLGFFYLPDHAIRVMTLFGGNIVAVIGIHLVYRFPQHLTAADLGPVSWFSMFSATAYMSMMAIYYAGILTMRSELERETERHRLMALRLRTAKRQADDASHGKTVFLAKMQRQFDAPLSLIVDRSQKLLDGRDNGVGPRRGSELSRIHGTARQLLELVHEVVDQKRSAAARDESLQDMPVGLVLDTIAGMGRTLRPPPQEVLVGDSARDLGRIRVDIRKLQQICQAVLSKAAAAEPAASLRLDAARYRRATGDWLEIRIAAAARPAGKSQMIPVTGEARSAAQIEAELEMAQLHCAVIGGTLSVSRVGGALRFTIEIPAAAIELPMTDEKAERVRQAS